MTLEIFELVLQHIMLIGAVVFLIHAYQGFKNYKIHRIPNGLNHSFMALMSGLYSTTYYLGTLPFADGISVYIFSLTFIFAFSAFYFYLRVIDKFLNLESKIVKICRGTLLFIICANILSLLSGFFFSKFLIFDPIVGEPITALGKVLESDYTTSKIGKLLSGIGMLIVLCVSFFLFFVLRKLKPRELLLQFGIVLSFLTSINDIVMGMGYFYFLFPLSYFGNAFEIFRFGDYFQKKAFFKVQELKAELSRVAQAAQVGYVASSITHDIRNPLTVIRFGGSRINKLLQSDPFDKDKVFELLNKIDAQSSRIMDITNMYTGLMYTEKKTESYLVNFSEVVSEAIELSKKAVGDIPIQLNFVSDIQIRGDKNVFVLSLTNLLNNSAQAINEANLPNKWILIEATSNSFSVTDSGSGIPQSIQGKIFDMQFTTKEKTKGTGLGLGIVRELLSKFGATIEVDSQCTNTKFVITSKY